MSPASHAVKFLRESYRRVLTRVLRRNAEAFAYPGFEGLEPRLLLNAAPVAGDDQFSTWIERVSVSSNGVQGDHASYGGVASADGRYVAFESDASNLVTGDTNGAKDVFVRDRLTGATERVSVSSSGGQSNGASGAPSISADGRYVLFESVASNLVPGDTNGRIDIFVHDRQTGTTQRVSVSSDGAAQNGDSQDGRISGDGRYAVFASYATNLVPGDTNSSSDIFVRDLQAGTTERVSVSSRGVQSSQGSYRPSISADGRYVTFTSYASLLVPGDRNSAYDVFVRDRVAGTTTLVDGGAGATYTDPATGLAFPTNSQYHPSVSADGRYVAFDTDAWTPASENDTNNGVLDVFLHDQQTDTTQRISVSTTGGDTDGASSMPSITADGRYVVFQSYATDLVPDDTNGVSDLFAYDLATGTMRRLSESADGTQADGESSSLLSSSLAGPYAAFGSAAANLTPGDTNGVADTYFVRLAPGATDKNTPLRIASDQLLANDSDPDGDPLAISEVSGTSQYGATVTLNEDGSITYDPSGSEYLHGLAAGDMANDTFSYTVSDGHGGTATATVTLAVAGVDDSTSGSDLQNTNNSNGDSRSLLPDLPLQNETDALWTQIGRVDASVGTNISDRNSAVTPDGRYVAFESASMAGGNGFSNIYLFDRQANTTEVVSVAPDGTTLGDADSYSPTISADGRYVAFSSQASNLGESGGQGCSNVFVYDRETRQVQLVSVGTDGATPGNGDSLSPSISEDGRYVAFASGATNLTAAGSCGIFVRDLSAATTELVSVTTGGTSAGGLSSRPVISPDGRYVAFQSTSTILDNNNTNARLRGNIYVHDRQSGTTTRVSVPASGSEPNGFMNLDGISADGQSVVFDSGATNLVTSLPSTNPSWSVYVAHPGASAWAVSRVSLGSLESYYSASSGGEITSDGRYVVFEAYTTQRHATGEDGAWDVLVTDLGSGGETRRLTEDPENNDVLNGSTRMSQGPSTIGAYAVLWSDATDLVPGDANGGLFVARVAPGATDTGHALTIPASRLLATYGTQASTLTISDVSGESTHGATMTLSEDGSSITYDPRGSTYLNNQSVGSETDDSFTYTVTDGATSSTVTMTVKVDRINHAPVIESTNLNVQEGSADGTVVGSVVAIDADVVDSVTYAIATGNEDGAFAINPQTGQITVADGTLLVHDTKASYSLAVTATDGGSLISTTTVTVAVNLATVAPAAPTDPAGIDLTIAPTESGALHLSWTVGETYSYEIIRDGEPIVLQDGDDVTVGYGEVHTYQVFALPTGSSPLSDAVAVSLPVTVTTRPDEPSTPEAQNPICGPAGIPVTWDSVPGAQRYDIYRKTNNSPWPTSPMDSVYDTTSYLDTNVSTGMEYRYKIAAVNEAGSSDESVQTEAVSYSYLSGPTVDLDIDSDNTSDGLPQQDGHEEEIENTSGLPGKIIVVNDGDRDHNGVPDFAEPTSGSSSSLVPMVVSLTNSQFYDMNQADREIYLRQHFLAFTYNAATGVTTSPGAAVVGGDATAGTYRIWEEDGTCNTESEVSRVQLTFVPSDTLMSLFSLFGSEAESGGECTKVFYVEAVRPSTTLGDEIVLKQGLGSYDSETDEVTPPTAANDEQGTVRVTAVQDMNANAYSGLVRLADGTVSLTATDFASNSYGMPWGQTRTFTNDLVLSQSRINGNGWSDLPYLIQGTSTMMVVQGGNARYFDKLSDGTYQARFDTLATLEKVDDETDVYYDLTEADGSTWRFFGFHKSASNSIDPNDLYPLYQRGVFQRFMGPAGDTEGTVEVQTRTADGKPLTITRGLETFTYVYNASGENTADTGKLKSVALDRRPTSEGDRKEIESVEYAYDSNGNLTDAIVFKLVTAPGAETKFVAPIDHYHYAFWNSVDGTRVLLLTAAGPDTYARNPSAADYGFAYYDGSEGPNGAWKAGRVKTQAISGAGTSSPNATTTAGGIYQYDYWGAGYAGAGTDGSCVGFNAWRMGTWVLPPGVDGNRSEQFIYSNFAGQQMLSLVEAGSDRTPNQSDQWRTFNKYDMAGRVVLTAQPSAVAGFNAGDPGLTSLKSSDGLITKYTYGGSGQPAGYLTEIALWKGETGVVQEIQKKITYEDHPVDGKDLYHVHTEKVYRGSNGTGAITTTYVYDDWTGNLPCWMETILPAVSSIYENGSGASYTPTTYSDLYGRVVWSKGADQTLSYTEYDDANNGAVILSVADVNSSSMDFTPAISPPSGFGTTSGLHLKTQITADDLGRPTEIVDPANRQTVINYYDTASESSVWSHLVDTTDDPPPPYSYTVTDRSAGAVATGTANGVNGTLYSKSETVYDLGGRVVEQRKYTDPNSLFGYYSTTDTYNAAGLDAGETDDQGTNRKTGYDFLGRPTSVTVDGVQIAAYTYDYGQVGDGTLTQTVASTGDASYATTSTYDYRGRLLTQTGPDDVTVEYGFDNLNHVIVRQTYLASNPSVTRSETDTSYDALGRAFRTETYSDLAFPSTYHSLTTLTWYDADGRVVKTQDANGLFTKTQFDSVCRVVGTYTGYGDASGYAAAINPASGTIVQQTNTVYDEKGNSVATLSYSRFPDTADGDGVLDATNSYATGVIRWYDYAGRLANTANVGREDILADSSWTRYVFDDDGDLIDSSPHDGIPDVAEGAAFEPTSVPNRYIVTRTQYNPQGLAYRTTDNAERVTETTFDAVGRATAVVENYVDGIVDTANPDQDRLTFYCYDSHDRLVSQTAFNAKASSVEAQVTSYRYDSRLDASLQTGVTYPDGSGESTAYDVLGRVINKTDARGVKHTYEYDGAGRLAWDRVTLPATTDVDNAILAIGTTYDNLGRVSTVTSYHYADGSGTPVNQVKYSYDGWGNITTIAQAHDGAVVDNTTPTVTYAYDDGAGTGTTALYNRLASVTYPDGTAVYYNYASGVSDKMDLVGNIASSDDPDPEEEYVAYTYLGAGTIVRENHPYASNDLILNYDPANDNTLAFWDRFGRVVHQKWIDVFDASLDEYTYAYDQAGNVETRNNVLTQAFNETYGYDQLNRLTSVYRGQTGSQTQAQSWGLDQLGNWTSTTVGNGSPATKSYGPSNEIDTVSAGVTPGYDAAGNMTSGPRPSNSATKRHYVYDAWNRLVGVYADSGGNQGALIASYTYDGLNHRIRKTLADTTARDYYYNGAWQVVNVYRTDEAGTYILDEYLWDVTYVDAPVLVNHNFATDGTVCYHDFYYTTDANHNVTSLVFPSIGLVLVRYRYEAYGAVTITDGASFAAQLGNEILFTGQRRDPESGLYLYRNRSYDPSLGRFIQRDPRGDVDGLNLYQYVRSNPTDHVDPSGEFIPLIVLGIIALVGAAAGTGAYAVNLATDGGTKDWDTSRIAENWNWGDAAIYTGVGAVAAPLLTVAAVAAAPYVLAAAAAAAPYVLQATVAVAPLAMEAAFAGFCVAAVTAGAGSVVRELEQRKVIEDRGIGDAMVNTGISMMFLSQQVHEGFAPYAPRANAPKSPLNASQQKAISSYRDLIAEHRAKLDAYKANPKAFDNQGLLKNAPNDAVRQRIIEGRIRHLENELKTFEENIKKVENGGT